MRLFVLDCDYLSNPSAQCEDCYRWETCRIAYMQALISKITGIRMPKPETQRKDHHPTKPVLDARESPSATSTNCKTTKNRAKEHEKEARMKKVYIAGPITNNPNYKEDFAAVAEKLKEMGLEPVNPGEAPEGLIYKEYIDMGLKKLMDCNAICCIVNPPGEKGRMPNSEGELLEYQYAKTVRLPLMQAWRAKEYDNKGKLQRAKWIIEIPECWPGMFGEEDEQ